MHDRGDYKHGWQLEREMEQGTYDNEGGFEEVLLHPADKIFG
jgi:hypothetical protein